MAGSTQGEYYNWSLEMLDSGEGANVVTRHPKLDDFKFWGFESGLRRIERLFQSIDIQSWDPPIRVIEDGIVIPPTNGRPEEGGHVRQLHGGIVDSKGYPVPAAHLRRHGRTTFAHLPESITATSEEELDEEMVYLGWLFPHNFGVFLLESLARTWYLSRVELSRRVVFLQPGRFPSGATLRILEMFGISQDRIFVPRVPTRVTKLIIPQPLYELYYSAHEQAGEPFRLAAAGILGNSDSIRLDQPVYLSRRYMSSDKRIIVGEAELEEVLRKNGVLVVYPERVPIDDQVRLFNLHTDVIACVGSALHNVLFARHKPRLHVFTAGAPEVDFFLVSTVARAQTTFVDCLGEWGGPAFPLMMDMSKLTSYMIDQGFISVQDGADLVAKQAELHEHYDEVLLRAVLRKSAADLAPLSEDIEEKAVRLSKYSWPVSWVLTRYYAIHDPHLMDKAARHFIELFDQEVNIERINQHQREFILDAALIVGASAATASSVTQPLVDVLVAKNVLSPSVKLRVQRLATMANRGENEGVRLQADSNHAQRCRGGSVLIFNAPREQLITLLPKGGKVAEIGVFRGGFSRHIVDVVQPEELHLIDPWTTESGSTPAEGKIMPQAYEMVLTNLRNEIASGQIILHREMSSTAAETFPDHYFDWIYVDAMHDYENVRADLLAFKDKVKQDGFILGHDFANHARARRYEVGVIRAVREFTATEGFDLILFTNENHPSFLITRSDNDTTLPELIDRVLSMRIARPIEIDEALLDRFEQTEIEFVSGHRGQMIKLNS